MIEKVFSIVWFLAVYVVSIFYAWRIVDMFIHIENIRDDVAEIKRLLQDIAQRKEG